MMCIQPYRTLDNVIEGAVITFLDITKLKKLEDELRLNQKSIQLAAETFSVAVFEQDKELRYNWIQGSGSFFSNENVLGKTDVDILPAEAAAHLTAVKRRVLESGKGTQLDIQAGMDGHTRSYKLTIEPVRGLGEEIIGIAGASLDITRYMVQKRPDSKAEASLSPKGGNE